MSEIEQQQIQWANDAAEIFARVMERANSYRSRENDEKALENYIEALQEYAVYVEQKSKIISIEVAINTQDIPPQRAKAYGIFADTLFELFQILSIIADYYETNSIPNLYLESRLLEIAKELGKYERAFSGDQINDYEDIKKYVMPFQSHIAQYQEQLAALKPLKEESNQELKQIRQALADISNAKICPITLEESGGCFIATVAYSDYFHTDLETFRKFRDNVLMKNALGSFLVKNYYKIGPQVAQYVNHSFFLKKTLKFCFKKVAYFMRLLSL